LVGLLNATLAGAGTGSATVRVQNVSAADRVAWTVEITRGQPGQAALPESALPEGALPESVLLERRFALTVAQESLARTGIACRLSEGLTAGVRYTLDFAKRLAHG
jgi:hypothetical protein